MTNTKYFHLIILVIARAKPVAIHLLTATESHTRPRHPTHDGLPRPSLRSLLAMTKWEPQSLHSLHGKNTTLVIARAKPVAIQ